jgi:hypothetical protein
MKKTIILNDKFVEAILQVREPVPIFSAISSEPLTHEEIESIQEKFGYGTNTYYAGAYSRGTGRYEGYYIHTWSC